MPDIFLSYSRKDSEHALALADQFEQRGVEIWIDRHGIEGAERWAAEIVEGIRACPTFLVLLSPNSVSSEHVLRELSLATEKGKRILPVMLEKTELPSTFQYALTGLQYVKIADFDAILRGHKHGIDRITVKDERPSLMILPFEDLSPSSEDNAWFADGLTGELISALSNIKSLRIPDRKTSMDMKSFRGKTAEIARELDVRYFIEGNVRKFGEQIKISMELLDIESGNYLWQHSWRGEFKDIFDIQEAVANEVVLGLKLHLTKDEQAKLHDRRTANPEAFQLFLRAGEYVRRHTRENYDHALHLYLEAGRVDQQFSETFAWAANVHLALYQSYEREQKHLEWAEELLAKALANEPHHSESLMMLSRIRLYEKRLDEAEGLALESVKQAPEEANSHFALGYFYYHTGKPDRAAAAYETTIRLSPKYLTAHWNLVSAYQRCGDREQSSIAANRAIPVFEQWLRLQPDDEHSRVYLANLYFSAGKSEAAARTLMELSDARDADSLYNLGCLAAKLGERIQALEFLTRARDAGFANMHMFRTDPDLVTLREMPEFQHFIAP